MVEMSHEDYQSVMKLRTKGMIQAINQGYSFDDVLAMARGFDKELWEQIKSKEEVSEGEIKKLWKDTHAKLVKAAKIHADLMKKKGWNF